MSVQITPAATVAIKDSGITPNPNPVPFAGSALSCNIGALSQDVVLAAATSNASLPFPSGVTTAKIIALCAATVTDLVVTVTISGQSVNLALPVNQPIFLYNLTSAQIKISSVLGGKLTCVLGG